jgi:opacity protein-like surface antigen
MKIFAATLTAVALLGSTAQAQMVSRDTPYFYLFGEYDHYTDSSSLNGGGGGLGWSLNRYLAVQAGAQYFRKSGFDITNFYGEVKLSLPLTERLSVYASAGGAYAEASTGVTLPTAPPINVTVSKSGSGYRAGLGAEYWFSKNWGLRAGWHEQDTDGKAGDLGVGIAFRF